MIASALIRTGEPAPCSPGPRFVLSPEQWRTMVDALAAEPELAFVGLWADPTHVHALFWSGAPLLASVAVEAGLYAALSPARPGAALFERMVSDLWGHQAADATDVRPWLDHGTWSALRPLSDRPIPNGGGPETPEMRPGEGDVLGLGPLPPTLAAPAHWRIGLVADRVQALEARLGYAHRGILGLMRGKSPQGAARLVARIDGAATVAHATAFARAVEAALDTQAPLRARALRTALLAIERVAVALHDIHATAAACGLHKPALQRGRADLLAACQAALGHRMMLDLVRPGGVHTEPGAAALALLDDALAAIPDADPRWPHQGLLPLATALALNAAGPVGRAAGRLDPTRPMAPVDAEGSLAARMALRLDALAKDVALARTTLAELPEGPVQVVLPHHTAEGIGLAQGPQGPVWHWVSLSGGLVAASFALDPAWLHLPAFEAAAPGDTLDSLPATAASFGLHLAGMEL